MLRHGLGAKPFVGPKRRDKPLYLSVGQVCQLLFPAREEYDCQNPFHRYLLGKRSERGNMAREYIPPHTLPL